jgi:hypothetical protein
LYASGQPADPPIATYRKSVVQLGAILQRRPFSQGVALFGAMDFAFA